MLLMTLTEKEKPLITFFSQTQPNKKKSAKQNKLLSVC